MDDLLHAITDLVSLVSPEKVHSIASCVRQTESSKAARVLTNLVGTPIASTAVEKLAIAWRNTAIGSTELASMLLVAAHVYTKAISEQSTELVLTGPNTPSVSTRRTEQALLQVINSAQNTLFITSFVAYQVPGLIDAMQTAAHRGVAISLLLELANKDGGRLDFDSIKMMKALIPVAKFYAWNTKSTDSSNGSVHAKVAVADGRLCFITSANLTGHAMEKNMEAGVLISGGSIPKQLDEHLHTLISMHIVNPT